MTIYKIIEDNIKIIDRALDKYVNLESKYERVIYESMRYSLFSGGKRLRPIIAIKTFDMFDDRKEKVLPYAAAIEMIHTYSLIHDDLPAMDDDEFRRGKPTNHIRFGEALAILAGDGLLNLAFETMSKDLVENTQSAEEYRQKARAIYEISQYAGCKGMIGGQVVDITAKPDEMDGERLYYMYEKKTAGLFQAATVAGAILGGARDEEVDLLRSFALNLGLAYQIQDDILDAGEDEDIDKLTYLSFYNLEKAKEAVQNFSKRAHQLLDDLEGRDTSFLRGLTELLVDRKV
ncbi:MAG: polyprenyl synthetase family protein [Tissierellaceae bacterium]|jgi:geranylgeranyl diphosphate synthase type II|nr:polyprenyl synthetase family protein [Tissierellia bacterium]